MDCLGGLRFLKQAMYNFLYRCTTQRTGGEAMQNQNDPSTGENRPVQDDAVSSISQNNLPAADSAENCPRPGKRHNRKKYRENRRKRREKEKRQEKLQQTINTVRRFFTVSGLRRNITILKNYLEIKRARREYGALSEKQSIRELHLFDRIQPTERVYCEMPMSDLQLASIEDGHRCRPYLILDKTENGIIGLPCSHKPWLKVSELLQYPLECEDYSQYLLFGSKFLNIHDSWVRLTEPVFVPEKKILSYSGPINETDIRQISRLLNICDPKDKRWPATGFSNRPYQPKEGDLLLVSGLARTAFLITSADQQTFFGYYVSLKKPPKDMKKEIASRRHEPAGSADSLQRILASSDIQEPLGFITCREMICQILDLGKCERPIELGIHIVDFISIPTLYALKEEIKARQHHFRPARPRQPKKPPVSGFTLNYPVGAIFIETFSDLEWVYMFTQGQRHYGVLLDDYFEGVPRLKKMTFDNLQEACEVIDEETFLALEPVIEMTGLLTDEQRQLLVKAYLEPEEQEEEGNKERNEEADE